MDSILELDPSEIRGIKEITTQFKGLLDQKAVHLFEDCFHMLLSTQAKLENFHLIKEISSGSE